MQKKLCSIAAIVLLVVSPAWGLDAAQLRSLSNDELIKQIRIYTCIPAEMDALLPELHQRFPAFHDRVKTLAGMYLGAPYVTDPLTDEMRDWLPYKAPNCTMLVLYIEALANSRSMSEAREHMRLLHYRGGEVGFASRYHFTEDRITDPANKYFSEVTKRHVRNQNSLQAISIELNRTQSGPLLFGDRLGSWTKKVAFSYVPRAGFTPQALTRLPRVLGVAFVKKENFKKGLVVGHEGLLIDGDLYHCSLKRGVRAEKNYLASAFAASQWDGLLFFRLVPQNVEKKENSLISAGELHR